MAFNLIPETALERHLGVAGVNLDGDQRLVLETKLNAVVKRVERFCSRTLAYGEQTENNVFPLTEPDTSILYLKRFPIDTVTSVTPISGDSTFDSDNAVDTSTFLIDNEIGGLVKYSGTFSNVPYEIVYNGGYDDFLTAEEYVNVEALSDDLASAIIDQTVYEFDWRSKLGLQSQSGETTINREVLVNGFLPQVFEIIREYMRTRI